MAELVMGTGAKQSLQGVAELVEKQLRGMEGAPLRITVSAADITFEAQRKGFEEPFTSYSLRLKEGDGTVNGVRDAAVAHSGVCTVTDEEGGLSVACSVEDVASLEKLEAALGEVCKHLTLPEVWRAQGHDYRLDPVSPELLFRAMLQYKASDIHLSPGLCPVFRIDGDTHRSDLLGPLSVYQILSLLKQIAPADAWQEFERSKQTSFNYHQSGMGYARVSAFTKSQAPHCTLRFLPEIIPSFEELSIPSDTMVKLAM